MWGAEMSRKERSIGRFETCFGQARGSPWRDPQMTMSQMPNQSFIGRREVAIQRCRSTFLRCG